MPSAGCYVVSAVTGIVYLVLNAAPDPSSGFERIKLAIARKSVTDNQPSASVPRIRASTPPARSSAVNPSKAIAILGAWQLVSYRGFAVVEKRGDRRLVIQRLLAKLIEEHVTVTGLLVVAEDAHDQWKRHFDSQGHLPDGWMLLTAAALRDDEDLIAAERIVVADEPERYLTDNIGVALTRARAVLGLCASPRGLADGQHLRKYMGPAIDFSRSTGSFEVSLLAEGPNLRAEVANPEGSSVVADEQKSAVDDPQDLLRYYLKEVQRYPLLEAQQEVELAKRIEAGLYAEQLMYELAEQGQRLPAAQHREMLLICRDGERAKAEFITANLRLAYFVARRYSSRIDIMDAIQEGNLGLIRAVEKFDYTKGYKFSTYATWWVRQAITRAIADQTYLIRLPVHVFEADAPVISERRKQAREIEKPSTADIAAALHLSVYSVESILARHRHPSSLEAMAEEGIDLMDPEDVTAHDLVVYSLLWDQLESVLETLSEREANIIRLRYGLADGEQYTLDEIGRVYGLTRERIRQVQNKAMSKLRHRSRSEVLRDYFEGMLDPELLAETEASDLEKEPHSIEDADNGAPIAEAVASTQVSSRRHGARTSNSEADVAERASSQTGRRNFPKWRPKTETEWDRWFNESGVSRDK